MVFLIVVAPSSPETLFRCRDLSFILASDNSVLLAFWDVEVSINLSSVAFFPPDFYTAWVIQVSVVVLDLYLEGLWSLINVIEPRSVEKQPKTIV